MHERKQWSAVRDARMAEPGAEDAFEAGGTVPTLVVLERLASAPDATPTVNVTQRAHVA
jgi:hypothetical protein